MFIYFKCWVFFLKVKQDNSTMETDQQTKDLNNQLPVMVSREAK